MSQQLTATMTPPATTMVTTPNDAVETTSRQPKGTLIPSLPDDVALNIIARIPRSDHPHLSLVSKTFYSLLYSPLLYSTRSLLNVTQPSLYVSLRVPPTRAPLWFTLHKTPSNSLLVPLPPSPSPPLLGSAFVAVGHTIYTIGGSHNDIPSPRVWALDCRFRSWNSVPAMKNPREFAAAAAVDGRIYVIGGCIVDNWTRSRHWAEVFDPKSGRWEAVDSVRENLLREKWMHASAVVDYKIFAMGDRNGVVYDTRSNEWWAVESELDMGWRGRACVVEGVLYCYDYLGKIQGYDGRRRVWRELRGVEKDLPKFLCGATMANVGGKLVVLWEGKGSGKVLEVWCAEIAVDKAGVEEEEELLGKVLWCNLVYKCSVGSSIVHCLAVDI